MTEKYPDRIRELLESAQKVPVEPLQLTPPPATDDELEDAKRLEKARKARAFLDQLARRGRPAFAVEAEAKLAKERAS